MKEITQKDLEELAKGISLPKYPKSLGNGLYQIADNCLTREKGVQKYFKELRKNIRKFLKH